MGRVFGSVGGAIAADSTMRKVSAHNRNYDEAKTQN